MPLVWAVSLRKPAGGAGVPAEAPALAEAQASGTRPVRAARAAVRVGSSVLRGVVGSFMALKVPRPAPCALEQKRLICPPVRDRTAPSADPSRPAACPPHGSDGNPGGRLEN